jgi:hypothetical protein
MDIVYYHERGIKLDEETHSVGINVLDALPALDILSVGGILMDLQDGGSLEAGNALDGVMLVVVEDSVGHDAFSGLERYLNVIQEKIDIDTTAVLVEKKNPRDGIEKALQWAASLLTK